MTILEVRNLSRSFGGLVAVSDSLLLGRRRRDPGPHRAERGGQDDHLQRDQRFLSAERRARAVPGRRCLRHAHQRHRGPWPGEDVSGHNALPGTHGARKRARWLPPPCPHRPFSGPHRDGPAAGGGGAGQGDRNPGFLRTGRARRRSGHEPAPRLAALPRDRGGVRRGPGAALAGRALHRNESRGDPPDDGNRPQGARPRRHPPAGGARHAGGDGALRSDHGAQFRQTADRGGPPRRCAAIRA